MLVWCLLALVNYWARHPIWPDVLYRVTFAHLGSSSPSDFLKLAGVIGLAGAMVSLELAASVGMGIWVLRWFSGRGIWQERVWWYSIVIGIGVHGMAVLGAGLVGFFSGPALLVIAGLGLVGALLRARGGTWPGRLHVRMPSFWMLACMAAAGVTLSASLLSALSPPHVSDELIYHLGLAKWFVWNHKVTMMASNVFFAYPLMDSMLYGLPVALGLGGGAKILHFVAGVLAARGIYHVLRDTLPEARQAAVLVFLTIPAVWALAGRAYNDLFILMFACAALVAVVRKDRQPGAGDAVLAGICVGLAGGNKYTGLMTGLMLIPFLRFRHVALAGAVALLTVSPWLVKNWIWHANPVYPFLWDLFGGVGWDEHLAWRAQLEISQEVDQGFLARLARLPLIPWAIPVLNYGSGPDGSTGALLAMAAGTLFVSARRREALAMAALAVPTAAGVIVFRFLMPLLPLILRAAARGLEPVLVFGKLTRRLVLGGVAILIWYQALEFFPDVWRKYDDPLPVLMGRQKIGEYLDRHLYPLLLYPRNYSRILEEANPLLSPESRVYFLGGYGGSYYLAAPSLFMGLHGRPLPLVFAREARDPAGIRKRMRQAGITHVLVNRRLNYILFDKWRMWDWRSADEVVRWRDFWDGYAVSEWRHGNDFALYRISPGRLRQEPLLTPGIEEEEVRLALFRIRKREFGLADQQIRSLQGLFPRNPTVWLRAAQAHARQGRLQEARDCCAKVKRLDPGSIDVRRCRAELAMVTGRDREAVELLKRILRDDPGDSQGWADLSGLYYRLGKIEDAEQAKAEVERTKDFPGQL